ncbi:hypothetical protein, partial [Candidatus Magnetobacterium casense]|uniref:hypothetical protein n=1 Tax=Candidatus Magnetobacterium casense TaxID=1455061 RepID=UPI00058D643F
CFISMLAYKVIRNIVTHLDGHDDELSNIMRETNLGISKNQSLTIDDIISELDMIQEIMVEIEEIKIPAIQTPSPLAQRILDILNITLPQPKTA